MQRKRQRDREKRSSSHLVYKYRVCVLIQLKLNYREIARERKSKKGRFTCIIGSGNGIIKPMDKQINSSHTQHNTQQSLSFFYFFPYLLLLKTVTMKL